MDYPDKSLLEAVTAKANCEPEVKVKLVELLRKWREKKGFQLAKFNKEYVKILLELFLLEDRLVSRQISQVLSDCLSLEPLPSGPPPDLLGQSVRILYKFEVNV